MDMDQETAKRLFQEGGFFILLKVPEGTEFGIDMKSWNTGEKFRGVKMIPPGIHYIFYSSVSNTGDTAPRTGFFHFFKKSEVFVKKWDKLGEGLSKEDVSDQEVVGLKENIKALDGFLGPYPYDILERWEMLTSNISEALFRRLNPLSGEVRSALELESCTDANRPRRLPRTQKIISNDGQKAAVSQSGSTGESSSTAELSSTAESSDTTETSGVSSPKKSRKSFSEDDFLPNLKPRHGTEIRLTEFPDKMYPEGSSPTEITRHSLDSSYVFEKIIETYPEPTDILGELEFCFICFLVGHSFEAFDQWKKIFSLFCSCEEAIKKYRQLYDIFLTVIEQQVKEVPEEFLADIVSNNNFVYVKLRSLFRFIQTMDVDQELKNRAEQVKQSFSNFFKWDFRNLEVEEDDEAPVVVELE